MRYFSNFNQSDLQILVLWACGEEHFLSYGQKILSKANVFCLGRNLRNLFCPVQKVLSWTKYIWSWTKPILSRTKHILSEQKDEALEFCAHVRMFTHQY